MKGLFALVLIIGAILLGVATWDGRIIDACGQITFSAGCFGFAICMMILGGLAYTPRQKAEAMLFSLVVLVVMLVLDTQFHTRLLDLFMGRPGCVAP